MFSEKIYDWKFFFLDMKLPDLLGICATRDFWKFFQSVLASDYLWARTIFKYDLKYKFLFALSNSEWKWALE